MGIIFMLCGVLLTLAAVFLDAVSIYYTLAGVVLIAMSIIILRNMPDSYKDAGISIEH